MTPRFAGSERHAVELANWQAQKHDVHFVLTDRAGEDRPDAWAYRLLPTVQQTRISNWRLVWGIKIRSALHRLKPDVVHCHLSHACKAVGRFNGSATRIATLHIRYKPQQHERLDGLVAIAPWQLDELPATLRPQARCIPNPSSAPPFDADARARIRAQFGIAPNDFWVGTLGRADVSKGWDVLLRAAADLPGLRLALVGNGPIWKKLQDLCPPGVVMPGYTSEPAAWMSAFDAFVSAARDEPFGLVFLEAMHAGLPVLSTATQGARFLGSDFLQPLLPCDDAQAMTQALRTLIHDRPGRRPYAMEAYAPEVHASALEAFYRECRR